jgi:hypothetical protein
VDPIREVQNLIPAWQLDRQLLYVPYAAFLVLAVCCWAGVVLVGPFKKVPAGSHWTERARLADMARRDLARLVLVCPALVALMAGVYSGPLSRWPGPKLGLAAGAAAAAAALFPVLAVCHIVSARRIRWAEWIRSVASYWLLFSPTLGLTLLTAAFLPYDSPTAPLIAGALVLPLSILISLGGGLWIARRSGLAYPARPEVVKAVHAAASTVGVPPPQVLELDWASPSVVVCWPPPCILVTRSMADALTPLEINALATGPLRRLSEPDLARSTRVALGLTPLLFINAKYILVHVFPLAPILSFVGYAVLTIAGAAILRRCGVGMDPPPEMATDYTRALERVFELQGRAVVLTDDSSGKSSNVYDRLLSAGHQPEYPRPDPPPQRGFVPFEQMAALCLALFLPVFILGPHHLTEKELLAHAAIRADAWDFDNLARISVKARDWPHAELYLRAEVSLDHRTVLPAAQLARVQTVLGHCLDAERSLAEAEYRAQRYHSYREDRDALLRARRAVPACSPRDGRPDDREPAGTYSQR